MPKSKYKPKRFAGAGLAISTGLQVGGTLINAAMQKQRLAEQDKLQKEASTKSLMTASSGRLDAYNSFLAQNPELIYGTRKEIQALGNDVESLAGDIGIVDAGTHESGNDLERQDDIVEGGEVVQGDRVLSNRIQAFSPAQVGAGYGIILDEIDRISKKSAGTTKGELTRLGDKVRSKISDVTAVQEDIKEDYSFLVDPESSSSTGNQLLDKSGKPIRALGDDLIGDFTRKRIGSAQTFLPNEDQLTTDLADFDLNASAEQGTVGANNLGISAPNVSAENLGLVADLGVNVLENVINARLLKGVPEVPTPTFRKALPMKTDIDVSDQISAARENRDLINRFVDENTLSSNTAIQRKRAASNRAFKDISGIRAEESRVETALENQDILNRQQVDNLNAALLDQFNQAKVARESQIISAKSANIANLSRDVSDVLNKFRLQEFQKEQLSLDALKYQDIGVTANAALAGTYDNQSRKWKQDYINSLRAVNRTAQADQLETKWGL
jgi:hypothetical protein